MVQAEPKENVLTLPRLSIVWLLLFAPFLSATTFLVPDDVTMVDRADAIVAGTVISSESLLTVDQRVVTVTTISPFEAFKGSELSGNFEVVENGGTAEGKASWVQGTPEFRTGERVLLFLRATPDGRWTTEGMALGKFNFLTGPRSEKFLVRGYRGHSIFGFAGDGSSHVERPRHEEKFLGFLRATLLGMPAIADYLGEPSMQVFLTRESSALSNSVGSVYSSNPAARWNNGATATLPVNLNGALGRDYVGSAQRAAAAWNSDPTSTVNYSTSGSSVAPFLQQDGNNVIVFNMLDLGGALGLGGWSAGGQHTFSGETWWTITEADVKISSTILSFSQAVLDAVVTHEIGHSLGFRHSDQGTPSSTDAVMKAILNNNWPGASLGSWDRDALAHMYGSGAVCIPPGISQQPGSPTTTSGQTVTLSFSASGSTPLTYQWYRATSPNQIHPVATTPSLVVVPASTTSYWVRVTNACGSANSNTSTITVVPIGSLPEGDVNGDNVVTVADVFYLVNDLFAGGPDPIGPSDVNNDGFVTVSDVFYLVNHLFAGGPAPL